MDDIGPERRIIQVRPITKARPARYAGHPHLRRRHRPRRSGAEHPTRVEAGAEAARHPTGVPLEPDTSDVDHLASPQR